MLRLGQASGYVVDSLTKAKLTNYFVNIYRQPENPGDAPIYVLQGDSRHRSVADPGRQSRARHLSHRHPRFEFTVRVPGPQRPGDRPCCRRPRRRAQHAVRAARRRSRSRHGRQHRGRPVPDDHRTCVQTGDAAGHRRDRTDRLERTSASPCRAPVATPSRRLCWTTPACKARRRRCTTRGSSPSSRSTRPTSRVTAPCAIRGGAGFQDNTVPLAGVQASDGASSSDRRVHSVLGPPAPSIGGTVFWLNGSLRVPITNATVSTTRATAYSVVENAGQNVAPAPIPTPGSTTSGAGGVWDLDGQLTGVAPYVFAAPNFGDGRIDVRVDPTGAADRDRRSGSCARRDAGRRPVPRSRCRRRRRAR